MRVVSIVTASVILAFVSASAVHGDEKELFAKFKRQNEQSHEKLKDDVKRVVDFAQTVRKINQSGRSARI